MAYCRSEHERHSASCRFIRNNANPNVPLNLTMSSLGSFAHKMSCNKPGAFIVSTTSNTEWLATACQFSSSIHLWRTDRVVQVSKTEFSFFVFWYKNAKQI